LLKKAGRQGTSPDRWAALSHNAQERTPIPPQPVQSLPHQGPGPMPLEIPSPYAALLEPPFPPPQPRHPFLDEIGKRHQQAIKSALPSEKWSPESAENANSKISRHDGISPEIPTAEGAHSDAGK